MLGLLKLVLELYLSRGVKMSMPAFSESLVKLEKINYSWH